MLGIRLFFTLLFGATSFLAFTVLGHPRGWLDVASFASAISGLVLTWRLARGPRTRFVGMATLISVLVLAAILPVRLAAEILVQMART